jgi:hypothetical protein
VSTAPLWGIYGRSLDSCLDPGFALGKLPGVQPSFDLAPVPRRRGVLEASLLHDAPIRTAGPSGRDAHLYLGGNFAMQRRFSLIFREV